MEAGTIKLEARHLVMSINAMKSDTRREAVLLLEKELKNLLFGNDNVDGFIYKTLDLSQFKDMKGNRLLNENATAIKELADSMMKSEGNVSPVVINREWEKVDGQRRILAYRKHGLPFPLTYIIRGDTTIETVGEMNKNQNKWNYKDWLHKHKELGKDSYLEYATISKSYEHFMRSRSLRGLLMNNRVDPLPSDVWENGDFVINHEKLSTTVIFLELLKKVYLIGEKDNIFAKDRSFQKALFEVYKNRKTLDEERLLVKIRTHFGRINIRTDFKTYKKILGDIYNTKLRGDVQHLIVQEKEPELQMVAS